MIDNIIFWDNLLFLKRFPKLKNAITSKETVKKSYRLLNGVESYESAKFFRTRFCRALLEVNKQIFASKYKLYLPTVEELKRELTREREMIEMERRLGE